MANFINILNINLTIIRLGLRLLNGKISLMFMGASNYLIIGVKVINVSVEDRSCIVGLNSTEKINGLASVTRL